MWGSCTGKITVVLTRNITVCRMSGKIGVILIGVGEIGKIHLADLVESRRVQVLWVLDLKQGTASSLVDQYELTEARAGGMDDLTEAYEDHRVSAVVISTPSPTHASLIQGALNAGKAVFCEKPLTNSVIETHECCSLARDKGLPLLCGFSRRFDPEFRYIYDSIQNGVAGDLRCVYSISRDPPSNYDNDFITSGLMFNESLVHDLDMLCWLVGERPKTVYAVGSTITDHFKDLSYPDTVMATLTFPNGVIGRLEVSWHSAVGYDQRVEVHGTNCMLQAQNKHPITVVRTNTDGVNRPAMHRFFPGRYAEAYKKEMLHFIDVLEGRSDVYVSLDSVIDVSTVLDAIQRSLQMGQPVTVE